MKKILFLLFVTLTSVSCVKYYDECSLCDDPVSRHLKLEFRGTSTAEQEFPMTIVYFKGNSNQDLASEIVQSSTSPPIIQSKELSTTRNLGFKINVPSGTQILINTIVITDLDSNEVIFENNSLTVSTEKLFMYDLLENSYTITN